MTKQWTVKLTYIANAVFRIVQNHGEKVTLVGFRAGVGKLLPAWTFGMVRIIIFVTQFRVKNLVKTKLHDKQLCR